MNVLIYVCFALLYNLSNGLYRKVDSLKGNPEYLIEFLWPIDFDIKANRGKSDPKRDIQVINILEDIQKFLINLFFLPSKDVEKIKLDFYNNSSKLNRLNYGVKRAYRVLGGKNEFTVALNGTRAAVHALFNTTDTSCSDSNSPSTSASGLSLQKFNTIFDSNSIKNELLNIKALKYPIFNHKNNNNNSDAFAFVISDNSWIPGLYSALTSLALFQTKQSVLVIYIEDMINAHFIRVLKSMGVTLIKLSDFFKGPLCSIKRRGTFLKFYLWTLPLPYQKILFIDIDTIITNNLDHIFELPIRNNNLFHIYASSGRHGPNTGLLLLRPSEYIASKLIRRLYLRLFEASITVPWHKLTDQEVIQGEFRYFRSNWKVMPKMTINTIWQKSMFGDLFQLPLIRNLRATHVIHYLGFPKPWHRLLFTPLLSSTIPFNFSAPIDPLSQFWATLASTYSDSFLSSSSSTLGSNISLKMTCEEHHHYFDFVWIRFWNTFTQCAPFIGSSSSGSNGLTSVFSFGSNSCEALPLVKSSTSSSSNSRRSRSRNRNRNRSITNELDEVPVRVFFNMSIFDPRLSNTTTTTTTTNNNNNINNNNKSDADDNSNSDNTAIDGSRGRYYNVFNGDYVHEWMLVKKCTKDTRVMSLEAPPINNQR